MRHKSFLPLNGATDFVWRDRSFLHKAVRNDRRDRAVEEVQDAVMNSLLADAQLIDPIAQKVIPSFDG